MSVNCCFCNGSLENTVEYKQFQDKDFHSSCCKCKACGKVIEGKIFFEPRGVFFCSEKCVRPQGSSGLTGSSLCGGCSQPFPSSSEIIEAEGKEWHPGCWKCSTQSCGKAITDSYIMMQNKQFCDVNCYNTNMKNNCFACGGTLGDNMVDAFDKKFHPQCFTCPLCQVNMSKTEFFFGKLLYSYRRALFLRFFLFFVFLSSDSGSYLVNILFLLCSCVCVVTLPAIYLLLSCSLALFLLSSFHRSLSPFSQITTIQTNLFAKPANPSNERPSPRFSFPHMPHSPRISSNEATHSHPPIYAFTFPSFDQSNQYIDHTITQGSPFLFLCDFLYMFSLLCCICTY